MTDSEQQPYVAVDLPSEPSASPLARRQVRGALHGWSDPSIDDASLLVNEVVSNAVEHGDPPVRLGVSVNDGHARMDVKDANPQEPEPKPRDTEAEHGRGMILLDELSDRWGVEQIPGDGKSVWFDVSNHDDPGSVT